MKTCLAISDTHGYHRNLTDKIRNIVKEKGTIDFLIHSGDFSYIGELKVLEDLNSWIKELKDEGLILHCVACPGNHDKTLQLGLYKFTVNKWSQQAEKNYHRAINSAKDYHLLIDQSIIIEGKKFYGTPYTPMFGGGWAFQLYNDEDKHRCYEKIPNNLDVLISHGPPHGYNDFVQDGSFNDEIIWRNAGCSILLEYLYKKNPKYHVCGHLHHPKNQFPQKMLNQTTIINASICDEEYKTTKDPIYFEI